VLQTKLDDELRLTKDTTDNLGITHLRYQQYYKGIKVDNAEYLVHGANQTIETINGDFQDIAISVIVPSLSEQQALYDALNFVNAKKYKWQDKGLEKLIKTRKNDQNATYYPKGELVITKDYLNGSKDFKLAWKFIISSLLPDDEQMIFVDAVSGMVINRLSLLCNSNTPITAQTKYSGTLGLIGDAFAGGYRLRETRNTVGVQTLNVSNGLPITTYVHYGANYNNAVWLGPQNNVIGYGDGDGSYIPPHGIP
jgi:bacillolysin